MSYINFIKESVSNIRTVGTVTRSSKYLSHKMIDLADIEQASSIVELGAGDGAITKYILERIQPDAKLFAFELNESFAEKLRELGDPRLVVINDDVANIKELLANHGVASVDHIISAIPFVAFPESKAIEIIQACKQVLSEKGRFIQLHYSLVLKKLYEKLFSKVEVAFVVRNLPPAWVFTCYL